MQPALTASTPSILARGDAVMQQAMQRRPPPRDVGLLGIRSNADLTQQAAREAEVARTVEEAFMNDRSMLDSLSGYVRKCWEEARYARTEITLELERCHRQRVGEYEPELMAQIRADGSPEVYVMLTDIKCRAVEAWMREVLLSGQDEPWDLTTTPEQDLPPEVMDAMLSEAWQAMAVHGFTVDQLQQLMKDGIDQVKKEWNEESERRAENMKRKIKDQLIEGEWEKAFSLFLTEFSTYPAAFILGPQLRTKKRLKYSARGGWKPEAVYETIPTWESVSCFDVYPQPGIVDIEDGYVFIHTRMDRKRLAGLKGCEGTREDVLAKILSNPGGYTSWLDVNRTQIDILRGQHNPLQSKTGMFDVLRFFGNVPGELLIQWGLVANLEDDLIHPDDNYDIEAWLIGTDVVYCRLNADPLGRKPLMKACAIEVPGQFWGQAIPAVMRDLQYICNASARALVENMGMASGPQVAVDTSMLAPGEQVSIKPWKVWPVAVAGNNGKLPIEFFQPEMHASELMGIYTSFARQADEVTGIPAYTYGGESPGGAGNTASGLSMLMGAASKGVRQMVSTCDRSIIRTNVTRLYEHNLEHSDDESIKGDVRVVPAGAVAIMQKETLRMRRIEFLGLTANPLDMEIIGIDGRAEVLRSVADSLEMHTDRVVPSREEMVQRRQAMEEQAALQASLGGGMPGAPGGAPGGGPVQPHRAQDLLGARHGRALDRPG